MELYHSSVAAVTAFTLGRCLTHRNTFTVYVSPVFVNRLKTRWGTAAAAPRPFRL